MKATKRRLEQFLFYDYSGIERHLERMASKGWQLHKITRFGWEYRRTEPRQLTYTVTYFSEASEFNPYPTQNQQTFYEYCKDAGWKLVTEWGQMQIFCAEREDPTPIETDGSVKLKAIHRAMKKNFLPSNIFVFLMYLFLIFLQFQTLLNDPVGQLSSGPTLLMTAALMILAVQMLIPLIGYAAWYRSSKKAVSMGATRVESRGYKHVSLFMWFLTAIVLVLVVFSMSAQRFGWGGVLGIVNVAALIALVFIIKNVLKRAKASKRINLTVTMVSCIILSVVLTGAMTRGIIRGVKAGWFDSAPDETYTTVMPNGSTHTWEIYHDPLPLKVEDLQETDYGHYSYEWTARESFLLAQYIARQDAFPDGLPATELNYVIMSVKLPAIFDICLNDYLGMYHYDREAPEEEKRYFRQIDDVPWQADAAYQLYRHNEALAEYILCWDNQIVYINYDEIPTTEQIAITVEKLSNYIDRHG
jgi:hypothetical protein